MNDSSSLITTTLVPMWPGSVFAVYLPPGVRQFWDHQESKDEGYLEACRQVWPNLTWSSVSSAAGAGTLIATPVIRTLLAVKTRETEVTHDISKNRAEKAAMETIRGVAVRYFGRPSMPAFSQLGCSNETCYRTK